MRFFLTVIGFTILVLSGVIGYEVKFSVAAEVGRCNCDTNVYEVPSSEVPTKEACERKVATLYVGSQSMCTYLKIGDTKDFCCCVKGGSCVPKTGLTEECAASDLGDKWQVGGRVELLPKNEKGQCEDLQPENICVCQKGGSLQCETNKTIKVSSDTERFTCDDIATDPHDCNNFCRVKYKGKALYCGTDEGLAATLKNTSILKKAEGGTPPNNLRDNGCAPTHCWCKNEKKFCSHDTVTKDGVFFLNDQVCTKFCESKNGAGETGWKYLKFEDKYTNYYDQDHPDEAGGCFFKPSQPEISPYDFTGNILADASTLNELKRFPGPQQFIGNAVRVILMFIGSIALVMYIYGGLMWMTAGGNSEQVGKAKQILVYATIGVIAMLSSYLLVQFVFGTVLKLG